MRKILYFLMAILLLSVSSCDRTPKNVISAKKMEAILLDIHKAEALMDNRYNDYSTNQKKEALINSVYAEHGVTKAQFDSSLVWYGKNLDLYMDIYDKVTLRLKTENDDLLAELKREERLKQTPVGDSVDIWKGNKQYIFRAENLTMLKTFQIVSDSNFKQRDRFELIMRLKKLPGQSLDSSKACLGVKYQYMDSVKAVYQTLGKDGFFHLVLPADSGLTIEKVYGNVQVLNKVTSEGNAVYADSIILKRIHYKAPVIKKKIDKKVNQSKI